MGRGGWGCAESGRRKALCTTFPGCRSGRLDFLHRDHRVALSGGNPRQTPRRGGGWGGQENRHWEEGEARRRKVLATQHERGCCFQGSSKEHIPPLRYPIVTGLSCLAPAFLLKKWLIFSQFCGLESLPKNTKAQHLTHNNRLLLSLPVMRIKC